MKNFEEKLFKLKSIISKNNLKLVGNVPNIRTCSINLKCKEDHKFSKRFDLILENGVNCLKCKNTNNKSNKIKKICKEYKFKWDEVIVNSKSQKLSLLCKQNHKFKKRYDLFTKPDGHFCHICNRLKKNLEENTQKATFIAKKNNAILITKKIYSSREKLEFRCSNEHRVHKSIDKINSSGFCAKCSKSIQDEKRKTEQFNKIYLFTKKKKLTLLSKTYENNKKHLKLKCIKGHTFTCSWTNLNTGHGCPYCSGLKLQESYEKRALKIAKKNKGKVLSWVTSKKTKSMILWECINGHQFKSRLDHTFQGHWCFVCAHGEKHTLKLMDKFAQKKGGRCLKFIEKTKHGHNLFLWECEEGHRWKARSINVYNKDQWCAQCSTGIGERFTRIAFESIFGKKFDSGFFSWLKNPETNRSLQLDGYNSELKIAFEHQGIFHDKNFNFANNKFTNNQYKRDQIKREICKKRGINLIEIPEIPRLLSLDNLVPFITQELSKKKIKFNIKKKPNYEKAYLINKLENFRKKVQEKGGIVIEKSYKGAATKHLVQCKFGHQWKSTPYSIMKVNGTWCPYCAGTKNVVSLEDQVKKILLKQKGILIDKKIKNTKQNIKILCSQGHKWQTNVAYFLRNKNTCNYCYGSKPVTLERAKMIAEERGGKCIKFLKRNNSHVYFLWSCKKNHKWEASFNDTNRGKWCKICRKE